MAEIVDPQIVVFANERARTIADKVVSFSAQVDAWLADWSAQGMSALVTAAGAAETIADGSATDGRQRITGTKLVNLRAALLQLQTALTATAVAGVGATPKAVADGIQVNGSQR
jgi:hypothetical protein